MIRGCRFVHCVLMRISRVALRVAVHWWSSIPAWDESSGVGQGMTDVSVGRPPGLPRSLSSAVVTTPCGGILGEGSVPSTLLFRFFWMVGQDAATVRRGPVA